MGFRAIIVGIYGDIVGFNAPNGPQTNQSSGRREAQKYR